MVFQGAQTQLKFHQNYVIFSKKKQKQFLDSLLKDKEKSLEEKLALVSNDVNSQTFYQRYLRAMHSVFRLKVYQISQEEFYELNETQPNLKLFNLLQQHCDFSREGLQKFVLIEMKSIHSKCVPNYNFMSLVNDPMIVEFKKQIVLKLR